jgi:molybdopterin molybdotransferase
MEDVSQRADEPVELIELNRYRQTLLSRIGPLEPIGLGLLEAHGCVLAEDVAAETDIPPFPNAGMDGFAVRAADTYPGAELDLVGEIAAGTEASHPLGAGEAFRIMTGAPVPEGADSVIPLEAASENGTRVILHESGRRGRHIRPAGQDVGAGEVVLRAGRRLGAADVGMLAAVGLTHVQVHPRPRVVVLSTGDELQEPGEPVRPGTIRDANSYALTALARESGATAFRMPIVPDDPRQLQEAFEGALTQADLLVTTGGVSAGRYDYVKQVLAQLGDVRFSKVGMQPGMPQAFGFLGTVPCFGLPGNPVSAYVSFEVFVRPALRRMQGRTDLNRPRVTAVLEDEIESPANKVSFLRVKLRRTDSTWHAHTTGNQSSGILRSVVEADGLAEIPSGRTSLFPGERVVVHLLVDTV